MHEKMKTISDKKIIESWHRNVTPWINAIQGDEIESRTLVTNNAIIDAIEKKTPKSVIDVGCGEGWLVRALTAKGIDCLGVDAVPGFIERASEQQGRFKVLSYEELSYTAIAEKFDLLVCNFSLLGKESVENVFQQAPGLLHNGGAMIVQTIHPKQAGTEDMYIDGWREGSWHGISGDFCEPAPWYFRTMASWQALFAGAGFTQLETIEPLNPKTRLPASVIFAGTLDR